MANFNVFAVDPDSRVDVPNILKNGGYNATTNGAKSPYAQHFNQIIFKNKCDHVWGSEAEVKAASPTATFYTDGSGNPLDKTDAAVVFSNPYEKIIISNSLPVDTDLNISGGGQPLYIFTDSNYFVDLGNIGKIVLSNANNSYLDIKVNKSVDSTSVPSDFIEDQTVNSTVIFNGVRIVNNSQTNSRGNPVVVADRSDFSYKSYRNLKISSRTNDQKGIDFSVEYASLTNESLAGDVRFKENVSILNTATLSGTGLNGRASSEGAVASNTWYYVYLIYDLVNDAVGVLFSVNSTWSAVSSSDKPPGYNYFWRCGVVRTNGSGDLFRFIQSDNYVGQQAGGTNNIGSTTSTSWVLVNISSLIPVNAFAVTGFVNVTAPSNGYISGTITVNDPFTNPGSAIIGTSAGSGAISNFLCQIYDTQVIYIRGTGPTTNFSLSGFYITI